MARYPNVGPELVAADARELQADLEVLWQALFGAPARRLIPDLNKLRRCWFGPRVAPASLRTRVEALGATPVGRRALSFDPPLVLRVLDGYVITPEGRLALEQLREQRGAPSVHL